MRVMVIGGNGFWEHILCANWLRKRTPQSCLTSVLKHHVYNAGTGKTVTMPEIGRAIKEVIPNAEFNFEEGFDFFSVPCRGPMDIKRAEADLGYSPKYSLQEAVLDYFQYIKKQF
jgi:nucleoside-diphosphate-sugar epimerase